MEQLNYKTLKQIDYDGFLLENAPERALQFGEGNFLRAFVEYFIDLMNEKAGFNGKVVLAQPIAPGTGDIINAQEGLYTLYLRGVQDNKPVVEKHVISSVSRCINPYGDYESLLDCAKNPELRFIFSNTTEAGIVFEENSGFNQTPPDSFPAKLTRFLYERYTLKLPGFIILSCELIDNNGKELEACVLKYCDLWQLDGKFKAWVKSENIFCSTLVDRIVTGYPRSEAEKLNLENGYEDKLLVAGEIFGLWVIEGPESIKNEFPCERAGLPIIITDDHSPFKQRKVRILNGSHTAMVPVAYMAGMDTVLECMDNALVSRFVEKIINGEIIPTLTLPEKDVRAFADSVADRFKNPHIRHELLSISLNGVSKWRARLMPSLLGYYEKFGVLPEYITFSFAALIWFYRQGYEISDGILLAKRGESVFEIKDDLWVLEFFMNNKGKSLSELASLTVENTQMWGDCLSGLDGFSQAVTAYLEDIEKNGMESALKSILN